MPTLSVNFANITRVVRNGTDYNQLEITGSQVTPKQLWRRVYINSSYPVTEWIDPAPYYEEIPGTRQIVYYFYWDPGAPDPWPSGPDGPYGTSMAGPIPGWAYNAPYAGQWTSVQDSMNYDSYGYGSQPNWMGISPYSGYYYWIWTVYYYQTNYVDPPGYYQTTYVDNSYWTYYY